MKEIGLRISKLLKEKNYTQKQFAEMVGITESALSHYIKGDRIPSGDILANIACALNTTANYILGKDDVLDFSNVKRILARSKSEMTDEEKAELIVLLFGKDERKD